MLEIQYDLTTSNTFLEIIAQQFTKKHNRPVHVENNRLIFPNSLAKGKFEFYNLDFGLSVSFLDITFFEDIYFTRQSDHVDFFHALTFNLSSISLAVNVHGASRTHIGDSWKNKIIYSTSRKALGWVAPKNGHVRMLVVYATREWIQKKYKIERAPEGISYVKELKMDIPIQFALDLDLEILPRVQDLLVSPPPAYMTKLYYKGEIKMLMALVAQRLIQKPDSQLKLKYTDVSKLMAVEQELKNNLGEPLPMIDELARKCLMSPSKFTALFKAVYGKNYVRFFHEVKMEKAVELLLAGKDTNGVAAFLGFTNVSHFIKIFKHFYEVSPKLYVKKMKKEKRLIPDNDI